MKPKKKLIEQEVSTDNKNLKLFGQVPSKLPPIFDGTRLLAYYIYDNETATPKTIKVTAESPDGPLTAEINILDSNILEAGDFVHKLAGRKKIQELQETTSSADPCAYDDDEMNDDIKKAIIQIGLENSLASKYTSFVGIDRKSGKTLEDKPMLTRDIKNQVPSGFGGYGSFMAMSPGFSRNTCSMGMPQPQLMDLCNSAPICRSMKSAPKKVLDGLWGIFDAL
jgi:hypothetical protein